MMCIYEFLNRHLSLLRGKGAMQICIKIIMAPYTKHEPFPLPPKRSDLQHWTADIGIGQDMNVGMLVFDDNRAWWMATALSEL